MRSISIFLVKVILKSSQEKYLKSIVLKSNPWTCKIENWNGQTMTGSFSQKGIVGEYIVSKR